MKRDKKKPRYTGFDDEPGVTYPRFDEADDRPGVYDEWKDIYFHCCKGECKNWCVQSRIWVSSDGVTSAIQYRCTDCGAHWWSDKDD